MATTHILSLPDELLALVARHVAMRDKKLLLPLSLTCRRLGRLAQSQLLNNVAIDSAFKLCAFGNTLRRRPDFRERVARLHVRYKKNYDDDGMGISDNEDDMYYSRASARTFPHRSVHATFYESGLAGLLLSSPLPALVHLSLSSFPPRLLGHLLREIGRIGSLPHLSSIQINGMDCLYEATGDTAVGLFPLLAAMPTLRQVDLHLPGLKLPLSSDEIGILAGVHTLSLWPAICTDLESAVPLVDFLPDLRVLHLKSAWSTPVLHHILSTAPCALTSLSVPQSEPGLPAGLERLLGRFTALEELELRARLDFDLVVPQITQAPIRKLAVDSREIEISDSQLDGLVTGMCHLRHLQLNHISPTAFGTHLGDEIRDSLHYPYDVDVRTAADRLRAKHRPSWTSRATAEDYARILRSAAASGMLVKGTIAVCLDWEQDFDRQFERCLVDYPFQKNEPRLLTEYYGPQRAGEAVRRHRSGFLKLLVDEEEARPLRRSSRRGKEAQR